MRYSIFSFLLFLSSNLKGQSLPIKDLVSIYKKDSSQLQNYFDSINYQYLKKYQVFEDKGLIFEGIKPEMHREFFDSTKNINGECSMLFYVFSNDSELNSFKNEMINEGFVFDSLRTIKLNTNIGDSIECYILNDIEIQLSDNDFKQNIKKVNMSFPMSAYSGQDVHMYSIIIRSKEY
jgi:hypothetical protein